MHDQSDPSQTTDRTIFCLGTDAGLPPRIRPLVEEQGLRLAAYANLADLHAGHPGCRCAALILDTALLAPDETIQSFVDTLSGPAGPVTKNLVVIAHTKDIILRLQALRAGAAAFFTAPVDSGELVERLTALCLPQGEQEGRVLVVEDDAMQALLMARILVAAGCQVRTLGDPLRVLEVMDAFRPDLVLMDLNLPGASGAELTAIIREHEAFASVPILFVSGERDPLRQVDALSMGGDAFIAKPIRPDFLVKAVTARLSSARAMHRRLQLAAQMDPVTGLATRHYFISRLERAIAEPGIDEPGNGLLIVVLDGASRIDEHLGTAGSELARERIGKVIAARLQAGDLAVRLDQRCHALLVRRPGADELLAAAQDLRATVAAARLALGGRAIQPTLSIGIGLFHPAAGDAITALSRAEKACAEAQAAGGDRVVIYQPSTPGPGDAHHERRIAELIDRALGGTEGGGGFRLFYQPLVGIQASGRHMMEVHLRLTERDAELVPDAEYLAVAARGGRLRDIDRWLLTTALSALKEQAADRPDLRLLVRQHLDTLASDAWMPWLRDRLAAAGLAERPPIIAVRTADLLEHPEDGAVPLRMLNQLGIDVCLLDVDQTAAAMNLVVGLQPPLVKIAAMTVKQSPPDRLLALISRVRSNGAEVILAGVDDPDRIAPLWVSGAHYVQGALIQEPMPDLGFDWTEFAKA
jgi:diguanylate cyclase (GGDEF)-like protein